MIKKILAICLIVFVLCSCSKMPTDLSSEENKSNMSEIEYTQETETQNTDISDNTDTEIITEKKKTSIDKGVEEAEEQYKEPPEKINSVPAESTPQETEGGDKNTKEKEETPSVVVPQIPTEPNATEKDCTKIAIKLAEYINRDRESEGSSPLVTLSGLGEYALYRSNQLITNFAHDTQDEREAATALEYGQYIDPSCYGMDGEPYYSANCGEAIAKAGYIGTVDYVAERFAILLKNSSGHWYYVGAEQYRYVGIGITYDKGMWYCCIAVAIENTDNL